MFKTIGMVYPWLMRIWIFLLILSMVLPCGARDIYKSTSEDGVVIYSDTYIPGAERVSVSDGQSSAKEINVPSEKALPSQAGNSGQYQTFSIAQPVDDETIRSNEGSVTVGLALSPKLAAGHVIHVYLNGSRLDADLSTQFSLDALDRGTHSLQAKIVDAEGAVQASTGLISFHLRKASIIKP